MSEIKLKSITIRRFIAYFLDSVIIGILFQVILLSGIFPINSLNSSDIISNVSDSKMGFSIVYFIVLIEINKKVYEGDLIDHSFGL